MLDLCMVSHPNANTHPHISDAVYVTLPVQMVKTTGGPAMGASVSSPTLTNSAVLLLRDNLNEEEHQLWTSLGPNWTLPRSVALFGDLLYFTLCDLIITVLKVQQVS